MTLAIEDYKGLISRYKIFLDDWYKKDQSEASRFNLFSILKVNWLEAKLHTPFITELLKPHGTHSQGNIFYKEFIKSVLPKKDHHLFTNINYQHLYVKGEEAIKGGFIDIYIHYKDKHQPFIIIIENKIEAGDQEKQLERYNQRAKEIVHDPDRIRLIYLTLYGCAPTEVSMNRELQTELTSKQQLLCISYQKNIAKWLKNCINKVKAETVKISIAQYLKSLESICNE